MSRVITLEDLEQYIEWNRKAQIVGPNTPQPIIQPSRLEPFVDWLKWQEQGSDMADERRSSQVESGKSAQGGDT